MPDPRFMAIIGAPNLAKYSTVSEAETAGFVPAGMEPAKLLTDEPSELARITTLAPWINYFRSQFTTTQNRANPSVAGFALGNTNLSRWGKYRLAAHSSDLLYRRQVLAPSAQLAATNVTGAVTNIDESPTAPDGLKVTPTSPGAWDARYSFPTPTNTPAAGADCQMFIVVVNLAGSAATTASEFPLCKIELWEGGTLKADLGCRAVTATGGQILIFRWNASQLTTASGVDVEARVYGSGHATLYVEMDTLGWCSEFGSYDHDTGWLASPFNPASASWGLSFGDMAGPEPVQNLVYIPATEWASVRQWMWLFSDDQAYADAFWATGLCGRSVPLPSGYNQAGVSVAGPVFIPSKVNFAKGPLLAARDPSTALFTLGGQEGGSRRPLRRAFSVTLPKLTEQEGYDLWERIDWRRGKKLPVLLVKYPDGDAVTRRLTTAWCTLEDMPGLSQGFQKHSWSGLFLEKR